MLLYCWWVLLAVSGGCVEVESFMAFCSLFVWVLVISLKQGGMIS